MTDWLTMSPIELSWTAKKFKLSHAYRANGQNFQNVEKKFRDWRPTSQTDWKIEQLWKVKLLSWNSLTTFLFGMVQFFQSVWLVGRQLRTHCEIFAQMYALMARVAEVGSLSARTKMAKQIFVQRTYLLFSPQICKFMSVQYVKYTI